VGIRTAFARYGDTFGTQNSGADFDLNDVYELVEIVDRLNGIGLGSAVGIGRD
jgi:putative hydrolase of the HAD superfamily